MDRSIEASGKTVKDAIQKGLAELGCTLDEVEYSVIDMGSPGFFGVFAKPAKVRMSKKDEHEFDIEMPTFSLDAGEPNNNKKRDKKRREAPAESTANTNQGGKQGEKPANKSEKKQPVKADKKPEKQNKAQGQGEKRPEKQDKSPARGEKKPEKQDRNPTQTEKKPEKQDKKPEQGAKPDKKQTAQPKPKSDNKQRNRREKDQPRPEPVTVAAPPDPSEPFVATPEEELSQTALRARDFLLGLTRRMNVPAEIEVQDGEENLRMVLSGENMSILIGRRGETLDAVQYLTSLYVNRSRDEYLRVTLDTENYRAKREETLRKLAVSKANQVKKSRRKVVLEPMNPNERRILHSALQNDPDVTTHSEGEEPYRRVIITLK